MKLKHSLILATALFAAMPLAYADDSPSTCSYINGGIGEEDQAMMHRVAKEFPLRIEFSKTERGSYLVDIPVTIKDDHDKVIFELAKAGPMLFLRLPKGKYVVSAVWDGETQSSKVTLDGKHSKRVILHWKRAPEEIIKEKDE
ncbi:MAG: hypothetical protein WC426_07415 [Sulfuriferula sp.]